MHNYKFFATQISYYFHFLPSFGPQVLNIFHSRYGRSHSIFSFSLQNEMIFSWIYGLYWTQWIANVYFFGPFFVWLAVQYLVAQPLDNLDRDPRKVLNVIKLQKTKASVFDTYTHQPECQGLSIDKEKPFE